MTRRSPLVLIVPVLRLLPILLIAVALRAPLLAQTEPAPIESATEAAAFQLRPVADWLEAQVELHRRGFSCGSIDGVRGPQTTAALLAFQRSAYLDETGELDRPTRESLLLTAPPLTEHVFTAEELGPLQPVPDTWLGKSERDRLGYATAIEFAGERYRASPRHLQRLNPGFDWEAVLPGTKITVPAIAPFRTTRIARHVHVKLAERALQVTDADGRLFAHFPVSIARAVDKRPVGELHVTVAIANPNYTFDPALFTESEEGRMLGRRLVVPPGPNNPVGIAWIGLDRPGYGIHGTPDPEKVGRTESHGCFRLANWDARTLLELAWVGLPVIVEP